MAAAPDAGDRGPAEVRLSWGLSRHARRLVTLSLAGLAIALLTGRPEFAGLAAPALLLLAAPRPARPERVSIQVRLTPARGYEGEECALDVDVTGPGDHEAELTLRPGEAIEPATGPSATGSRTRFTITSPYWGRRRVGSVGLVLRDPGRLTEGRATAAAPALDCYPRPAARAPAAGRGAGRGRVPAGRGRGRSHDPGNRHRCRAGLAPHPGRVRRRRRRRARAARGARTARGARPRRGAPLMLRRSRGPIIMNGRWRRWAQPRR